MQKVARTNYKIALMRFGISQRELHYQLMTGKKAMVVLILEDPQKEMVYYNRVKKLGTIHGFDVAYITPEILNIKDGRCPYVDCKCHKHNQSGYW